MGISITSSNSDFYQTASRWAAPVTDGLQYLNFFDTDSPSGRNLAANKDAGVVVGAPGGGVGYRRFNNLVNLVETGVLETESYTFLVATRLPTPDGSRTPIMGSFLQNTDVGVMIAYNGADNRFAGFSKRLDGGAPAASAPGVVAPANAQLGWNFLSFKGSSSVDVFRNATQGAQLSTVPVLPRAPVTGRTIRIGSHWAAASGYAGPAIDIAFAAIYSRVLSDEEVTLMYAAAKAVHAPKAIAY